MSIERINSVSITVQEIETIYDECSVCGCVQDIGGQA